MPLPVEKAAGNVNEVRLRHVVYDILIDKYLEDSGSTALAISEKYDGFSSVYTTSRERKGLVVNHRSFYFTPTSWNQFIDQYITLDSIKVCNLNHLYWLPSDLLVSTIIQMPNLEELSIKGTKVCTFRHVGKILKACPKVVKLDFTYTEQKERDIWSGLLKEERDVLREDLVDGFRKLTRLKMSTVALDAKNDILNDPWYLIIEILTWCRDCKDLSVEITYAGVHELDWSDPGLASSKKNDNARYASWRNWAPELGWMFSLQSLVLIKMNDHRTAISRLLDDLCHRFFPSYMEENEEKTILPLRRLWIQGFETILGNPLDFLNPKSLQSFNSGELCDDDVFKTVGLFPNLENLNLKNLIAGEDILLEGLEKLKFYCGIFNDEAFYKFCKEHSSLEHLDIDYNNNRFAAPTDVVCKLHKLKSFTCYRHDISKEFVEAMVEAYPNLEILRVTTHSNTIHPDGNAVLSAFRFPHLTTLSLCNLQLLDGFALISIINGCLNLEMIQLKTDSLDSSTFASNLEIFLRTATKLRDFSLRWDHKEDVYTATAFSILKAIFKGFIEKSIHETKLERLALIDAGTVNLPRWNHPPEFADFLVDFTAKMTHLYCCCITYKQMDANLMKAIKERVEEEVVIERPALWFHLGRDVPDASDPGVPPIHYHQIVEPISFTTPPFYSV